MTAESLFRRMGVDRPLDPTLGTLSRLQEAFLLRIPFENLDIHLGRPISLDPERIRHKIVDRNRGGFCYECNILFHAALRDLGFEVDFLSARMATGPDVGPEFDHMVLLVSVEGIDYLVDVGNGQSARTPHRLGAPTENRAEGIGYRMGRAQGHPALMEKKSGSDWAPRFLFDTTARDVADFETMCRYHQTSPDSHFTRQRFVTMATADGRMTLAGRHLSIHAGGTTTERTLSGEEDYAIALRTHFGIDGLSFSNAKTGSSLDF